MLAARQVDDHIRTEQSVVGLAGDLLVEGAASRQPGQLEATTELHLAPHAADLRSAQRLSQGLGLLAQFNATEVHGIDLLLELRLPRRTLTLQRVDPVVEPVKAFTHRLDDLLGRS